MRNGAFEEKNSKIFLEERRGSEISDTITETASAPADTVARMVEDVVGCKWTMTILGLIRSGLRRPGIIERSTEGLTTKVMNERLTKLVRYNILLRTSYPEIPPRVEYDLTEFGKRFITILDAIEELEQTGQTHSPSHKSG